METIFKVGMKVYDSVLFPKSEGKVVKIEKHIDCERVIVQFDCLDYELSYTGRGLLTSTHSEATPTLSTSPYTFKGFEQKAPAPTYEEVRMKMIDYVSITKPLELPNERLSNAFEALSKLIWLRDYYNDGWKPNWDKISDKYCIGLEGYKICAVNQRCNSRVMYFKSEEIRDKFLEDQRELLEIAKPLL